MTKIKDVINYLETWAPASLQEGYDNSKLIVGDNNHEVSKVLITLDCVEEVVEEAISIGANLIIAHHPIVFKGLKSFTGKDYVERTVIKAIKNDIAIYAIHTNLDNVITGVNAILADKIGIKKLKVLQPKNDNLQKLVVFVPSSHTDKVLTALGEAGAGQIGEYKNCSFTVKGTGRFEPSENANPFIGETGNLEKVEEDRIEAIIPKHKSGQILNVVKNAHPYEEMAYYINDLVNYNQDTGSGMIGVLDEEMEAMDFLLLLKERLNLKTIRHTNLVKNKIKKVGICGGAGSFLLSKAKSAGCDIYITGDFKYHEFFDAEDKIIIADIGHYESEVFTKELIKEKLYKKFTNIAFNLSEFNSNPVNYL
ncbi:Nif3-like dinuclear metal center hexameric protein [Marinigracilibium pacificum]|uniref:GTP cyclohydrolase 1 type 2 homolog n=1 Tax=Marinigracilibium pacificum TaxID=2729599 RepID=A0A848IWA6_9BACT|nr:Nif3-like dinuclear metal center hexameric protein [Marinigracilibium pacificum]NMM47966.1 Nif3-like dinuclear metal center hexameric protein [Marinigracilibium pacificum]